MIPTQLYVAIKFLHAVVRIDLTVFLSCLQRYALFLQPAHKLIIKMRKTLLLAALIMAGNLGFSQNTKVNFVEYDLPNGLHVILSEDHSSPIVAVSVMYHVGSKNEKLDRTGFAHFFEHLLFEGSENIARGEFDDYVENAGGILNANTSQDRTFYFELLPSNQMELALWLESERMLHARVDQVGIETQREVVKEERRQRYENQPYGTWMEEMMKLAYAGNQYAWTPIGSMEHLNAAAEEDYINFYKTYYVPNNATLTIVGDLNTASAKRLISKYFKGIPKGKATIKRPSNEYQPLKQEIRKVVSDNVQLEAVFLGYKLPSKMSPDYYAASMVSNILSTGKSARLKKHLVDEKEVALQAFSMTLPMEYPGLSIVAGFANFGKTASELEEAMNYEIQKLHLIEITEKEYEKLMNQLENRFVNAISNNQGIAEQLSTNHSYYKNANLINTEFEKYKRVSRKDIMEAARKYFAPENRVVLHYVPNN